MRRGRIITVLGFLVAVLPALGIPQSAKDISFTVLGILIAFIGLTLRRPPRQPSLFPDVMESHDPEEHEDTEEDDHDVGNEQHDHESHDEPNHEEHDEHHQHS